MGNQARIQQARSGWGMSDEVMEQMPHSRALWTSLMRKKSPHARTL